MSIFGIFRRKKKEEPPPAALVPIAPGPGLPAEIPGSVFEILGPPEERGLIRPKAFEVIPAPAPEAFEILPIAPPPSVPPLPAPPPRARPRRTAEIFAAPPPRMPPRGLPSVALLDRFFNLDDLWNRIESGRQDPAFVEAVQATERGARPAEMPLILVAPEERGAEYRTAKFFGIPEREIDELIRIGRDPWAEILNPFLYDIERALIWAMPDWLPGTLAFGLNNQDEFGLIYFEESPLV